MSYRVLVTGSRTWVWTGEIYAILDALHDLHGAALTIVHGAATSGADAITDAWCRRQNVHCERHPANWARGKAAGIIRNAEMVASRPDECQAFIRDSSPGATHCADLAEKSGIPTERHLK